MKKINYSIPLRIVSAITLFFFCWVFAGLADIAYAADREIKQLSKENKKPKEEKSEEKFEKTLSDLEQVLLDPKTDTDTKKNKIKIKKDEIESLDIEIKKQFADTEKKLKDEGLPQEILERHYNFVKHYENNLNELKNNLDKIEKAKDKKEADEAIDKTQKFLEKVKPPKKHVPLDPNKLPYRTPEAQEVTLEERPPDKKVDPSEFLKKRTELENIQHEIISSKQTEPILVATNTSLKGLLNPGSQLLAENYIQIAQATTESIGKNAPPTSEDLQETQETKITPAISAKAAELGNNPYKMWNWVLNNVDFVPTYGSIQGADMCLQTRRCNAFDTASLVIALFRASGFPSRYIYATKELPIDKFMNWIGGFTDPMAALSFAASAGIPVKGITVGGQIKYVQFEHIWPISYIPYLPSRQGRPTDNIKTWIHLDASMPKYYEDTSGIDIKTAVPFDAQSFIEQIKSSAMIDEVEGYVTDINSSYIQQTMTDYQTQVENYITQNYPNATVEDVIGKREIIQKNYDGFIPGTEPLRTIAIKWKGPTLPNNLIHKVSFNIMSDNILYGPEPLNITKSLPEIAGKKITLSYIPATSSDEAVINFYLSQPRAVGSPIEPNEIQGSLPAYLIQIKPELRIDGTIVATGGAVGMGEIENVKITLMPPTLSFQVLNNKVITGEFNAFAFDVAPIKPEQLTLFKNTLEMIMAKLRANDPGLTKDDTLGNLLYATVLGYFAELDYNDTINAKTMEISAIRLPSVGRFFNAVQADYIFGTPLSAYAGGLSMDIGLIRKLVRTLDGTKDRQLQFMLISGLNSSVLEHSVPEQLFSTQDNQIKGISAVRALQIANNQGVPIYSINQSNVDTILSQLQIDQAARDDIQNAVNAGKIAIVSKSNIIINGWTGCGYIIGDPNTGAGAYMISGGTAGAYFGKMDAAIAWMNTTYPPLALDSLINWIESKPPAIVLAAASYAGVDTAGAIGGGYAGAGLTTAALTGLGILTLAFIISIMIDEIKDSSIQAWWTFYHYTTPNGRAGIMSSGFINPTPYEGDLGIGAYIADFFLDPSTPANREVICRWIGRNNDPVCLNEYTAFVVVQVDEYIMVRLVQGKFDPRIFTSEEWRERLIHQYMYPLGPLGPVAQPGHVLFE